MSKSNVIVSLILLTLLSCKKHDQMTTTVITGPFVPPAVADTASPRSYLALGDSYTIGQSVPETDRYPVLASKYLTMKGTSFNAPEIIAQTGWTTGNLLSRLAYEVPMKTTYDIVTLLIGVNNQYQQKSQEEYANEFQELLNMAIHYAGNNKKRVIVLSIPDYSVTPFANGSDKGLIARQIDSFNVVNQRITEQSGAGYLYITGWSRAAANDLSLIAPDGLHPSGLEYQVWADALVPVMQKALK